MYAVQPLYNFKLQKKNEKKKNYLKISSFNDAS